MKKVTFLLIVLLSVCKAIAQSASYPEVERQGEKDVFIKKVTTNEYYTQIDFVYKNTKSTGHYILLNPPGHTDAYYIKANGLIYNLLSTQNIGNKDRITLAMPNSRLEFSARFEKIPSYITQFDLIEGAAGTWDFYGVKLNQSQNTSKSIDKFRIDYNYISVYDSKTDKWGDWQEGDNTFVININEKGDIAHLKANGETVIYKKLSGVEEGYTETGNHHYQIIKALDEDGDVFRFQLFDDTSIGLKMMWGTFMIQFVKM